MIGNIVIVTIENDHATIDKKIIYDQKHLL